ncbi:MAG: hypothetical protein IKO42_08075, partial [Opitutales bacterium]|nr:hypothetical protein [Opitutales bacterium]
LKIMEIISSAKMRTICFVNPNAISAGSYIALACGEIWFSPRGVMGAAESVLADGSDVSSSMKRKIESFLSAKTKAVSGGDENRHLVQRAMSEPDFELSLGGEVLKKKGELLSLTSNEAVKNYGGKPLLASGIADSSTQIMREIFGEDAKIQIDKMKLSAFEKIAKYIVAASAVLMGIGMFLLFLEFKTAGFGVLGILGAGLMLVVFFGSNIAGFAGYEAAALFAAGLVLVLLEIFLFTGTFVCALLGIVLIIASIILSGASIPEGSWLPSADSLSGGLWTCVVAVMLAFALLAVFGRFFKRTGVWKKFVLEGGLGMGENSENLKISEENLVGQRGLTFTEMVPNGKVEIGGKIFDATNVGGGFLEKGVKVVVVGRDSFQLKIQQD